MRLSTLGRYALRAMVDLALHQGQGPVLRKDIVARQEISSDYLAHLFGKLKHAGLIQSLMGPGGGYVLARSAAHISAGDVLRAVDEILEPVFCVDADPKAACSRVDSCATHLLWAQLGRHVVELLDSVTLAELCAQSRFLAAREQPGTAGVDTETACHRLEWESRQRDDWVLIHGAGI